jgi:hypothetical protein
MGTSPRINKIKQHFIERRQRDVAKTKTRDDEAKTLRDHQPLARFTFLALVGMLLYLSTVGYNTTHLDLLLNTKVGVVWSLVELPRRWVLGVGSLVLVVIHYEAISLHHRVNKQFLAWLESLPKEDEPRYKPRFPISQEFLMEAIRASD